MQITKQQKNCTQAKKSAASEELTLATLSL